VSQTSDPSPRRKPDRDARYDLGRMDMQRLVQVYFSYPAVLAYLGLSAVGGYFAVRLGALERSVQAVVAAVATILAYPLIWYVLHRVFLHGRLLYRSPLTARLWKRVHYDHHQKPQRMDVLFGSLTNTLPTITLAAGGIGWAIGGPAIALTAVVTGLLFTCFYEFCHCIQHLNYLPKSPWLQRIKRLHMAHHFHNEKGNFGIISFWPDRLFGTFYADPRDRPRSPTVFNLGYDGEDAIRYPWVAELSREPPPSQP
jgi:sterol desaturase/sphingolipid hydroxylase (fatty acid hydroxylase superfamily)